jgi:hypothetical protein
MRSMLYILVFALATSHPAVADVPSKFFGEWTVEAEKGPGFPWWDHIKYPISISITKDYATFRDQNGNACEPPVFFYDEELDALIFTHCLPTKSEDAIRPFHRAKVNGARLQGETWTYKSLFRWTGERQD